MLRKLTMIGVFVAALVPSAYFAWTLRTMPHLGFYHDDSIYWVSARSLATGDGYRIQSLPGQPYQTKYPPLYPALLATIWKLDPRFPANLPLATLFAWLLLPLFLAALWFLLRDYGFSLRERYVLLLMAALSPVTVVFSFSLMPELLFARVAIGQLDSRRAGHAAGRAAMACVAGRRLRGAWRIWRSRLPRLCCSRFRCASRCAGISEKPRCSSPRWYPPWPDGSGGWRGTWRIPGIW